MKTLFHFTAVLALLALLVLNPAAAHASSGTTITVNTNDGAGNPSDGYCSLPEAIARTNAGSASADCPFTGTGTPYTVQFNISGSGVQTISISFQLENITVPVIIDGTTQPGYSGTPLIRVDDGSSIGYGFWFDPGSEGSVLKGLMVTRFTNYEVFISAGNATSHVTLLGNYIGTDGTIALGGTYGVYIIGGKYAQVGGPNASDRNVISGNSQSGVEIYGNGDHNTIQGNYINLNATGTAKISGGGWGIVLSSSGTAGANYNQIIGNVIAGGIEVNDQYETNNLIQSNYIGTDASGTAATGGNGSGIALFGGDNNQITGNLISGNGQGISVQGGTNTKIFENKIGTDKNGTSAIPNGWGIYLIGAPADIGDATTPGNNLISGNTTGGGIGIDISGAGASGTTVFGNKIGVSLNGDALPNWRGIDLGNGASAQVAQNYIADHSNAGIFIEDNLSSASGSNNCFVNNGSGLYTWNTATEDFSNNWWGSATGPTIASNPTGTGDLIHGPGASNVTYSPFLTSPAAACAPQVGLSSSSLDFGLQQVSATSTIQSVTLTNIGMGALDFSSIIPPASFNVDPSSTCLIGTPVAVNGTCTIALTFSPTVTGSAGGNVEIDSDASNSPTNIAVSGTGIGAQLLKNPDFEGKAGKKPANWKFTSFNAKTDGLDCVTFNSGSCSLKLVGNGKQKTVSETINIKKGLGLAGDSYAFGLSSEASSVPGGSVYMAQVLFYNKSALVGSQTLNFSTSASGFQTLTSGFTAPSAYTKIVFKITFTAASGTVWFDTAGLYHSS